MKQEEQGAAIVKQSQRNAKQLKKRFPGQEEGDDYKVNTFDSGEPNIDLDIRESVKRKKPAEGQKFSGR